MKGHQSEARIAHAMATSKALKRRAEARRCPQCGRGAALTRRAFGDGTGVVVCRWKQCGYERGWDHG